jgi:hypothetical protein
MCSGPISLESVREHEIPGFLSNEDIVHLPLEKATRFLAQLDQRETAANAFLRERSVRSAEIVSCRLQEEVEKRISASRQGQGLEFDAVEWLRSQKRRAEAQYAEFRERGYSDLWAKIASRVAIYRLGVDGEADPDGKQVD